MPLPHLQFDLGFGSDPLDEAVVWSTVTGDVLRDPGPVFGQGRDRFTAPRPGSFSFRLRDDDGTYDPSNSGGPWYGQLRPMLPVRVVARHGDQWAPIQIGGGSEPVAVGTGDLIVTWQGRIGSLAPSGAPVIFARQFTSADPFLFQHLSTGVLRLQVTDDNATGVTHDSTVTLASVGIAVATDIGLRVTLDLDDGANSVATFEYLVVGGTWTQLGATVTGTQLVDLKQTTLPVRGLDLVEDGARTYFIGVSYGGVELVAGDFSDKEEWRYGAKVATDSLGVSWSLPLGVEQDTGVILFEGFVGSWESTLVNKQQSVTVTAYDALTILSLLTVQPGLYAIIAAANPLGWWKLDETSGTTAVDSGSAAVDGTYTNTPTLDQTGPLPGTAFVDFEDGAAEHVVVGALTGSNVATGHTVAFWVLPDAVDTSTDQSLVAWDSNSADDLLAVGVNGFAAAGTVVAHDATSNNTTASGTSHSITLPAAASNATVIVTVTGNAGVVSWPSGWTVLYTRNALSSSYVFTSTNTSPGAEYSFVTTQYAGDSPLVPPPGGTSRGWDEYPYYNNGWTYWRRFVWAQATSNGTTAAAYKTFVGAADASITLTTSAATTLQYACSSFTGVDAVDVLGETGLSGTLDAPSLTASKAVSTDSLWVSAASGRRPNGPTAATPSGYTLSVSRTTAADLLNRITYKAGTGTVTENPAASDSNTSGYAVTGQATIALHAAPAGAEGLLKVRFTDTGADTTAKSTGTQLDLGVKSHVVCTLNADGNIDVYVDGVHVKNWANWDPTADSGEAYVTFGKSRSTFGAFDGQLSNVVFYQSVLTAAQVADLYAQQLGELVSATTGVRVGAVLDLVGWPSSRRSIDTGSSTMEARTGAVAVTAAEMIREAVDTEAGLFLIQGGDAVFLDRGAAADSGVVFVV